MFFMRRKPDLRLINTCIRCYGLARKTHYEILNLRKNCSEKEIKEAFIQLSKEFHPDINKDSRAQEKFVRILEAYNVLSKPSSRAQYDNVAEVNTNPYPHPYAYKPNDYHRYKYNTSYHSSYESFYRKASEGKAQSDSYYGFTGIKKVPNYVIIMMCFSVAMIGIILQVIVIGQSYKNHRQQVIERSKLLGEELDRVRAAAKGSDNERQTRLMLEKIVAAANPAVTTASLGQALASEKKGTAETLLTEFGVSDATEDWPSDTKVTLHEIVRQLSDLLW